MPAEAFAYDLFLSRSAKDKAVVRPLAERLCLIRRELLPFAFCLSDAPR